MLDWDYFPQKCKGENSSRKCLTDSTTKNQLHYSSTYGKLYK